MRYFVNCLKRNDSLSREIKELVPEMNMRRRMSRVVKMGVTTGVDSLMDFEMQGGNIEGIVSATGLGCIADSEKFLANIISSDERQLNPTPFIQSTFNTVGAQIALIRRLHCYNNTFSQRHFCFESALLDAMLLLDRGLVKSVLVVLFDEATPTVEKIMSRLGLLKGRTLGEGAFAFVLSSERLSETVAEIESVSLNPKDEEGALYSETQESPYWYGAMAELFYNAVKNRDKRTLINNIDGVLRSKITLKWL